LNFAECYVIHVDQQWWSIFAASSIL